MRRKEPNFVVKKYFPLDLVKPNVKKIVETIVKTINTGTDARLFVVKKKNRGKWQAKMLDNRGNVIVLSYRGIEVALFYKRETVEYRQETIDPTPYAPIVNPDNTWVRMEFMHMKPAAKRDTYFQALKREVQTKVENQRGIIKGLKIESARLEGLLSAEMNKSNRYKNRLERLLHPKKRRA